MGSGHQGRKRSGRATFRREVALSSRIESEFAATPAAVRQARAFVEATLAAWDLDDVAEVAVLLTSELTTNAVRHARTAFTVAVACRPPELVVEVGDGSDSLPVQRPKSVRSEGGRGLQLVAALARSWGTRRRRGGGKVVWFQLDLPAAA